MTPSSGHSLVGSAVASSACTCSASRLCCRMVSKASRSSGSRLGLASWLRMMRSWSSLTLSRFYFARNSGIIAFMRAPKPRTTKICPECSVEFQGIFNQKFCTLECSSLFNRKRRGTLPDLAERECVLCGIKLLTRKTRQKYCSEACRRAHKNKMWNGINQTDLKLSCGTTGAIAELLVASDLLSNGYEVFRALSPSCSCDLAILKDGQLLRVEVTTAYLLPSGKLQAPKKPQEKSDIVAYVIKKTKEVVYEPALDFNPHPR
jgi:hypothetical protein